jgi:hypothetical protein
MWLGVVEMAGAGSERISHRDEEVLRELMELPIGGWEATDLLRAREGLGMTQAELAADIGYERSADGYGVYGITGDRMATTTVSFAFDTGEIWSVDTYLVSELKKGAAAAMKPGIPYLEDRFKFAAHCFRIMLSRLELHPPLR